MKLIFRNESVHYPLNKQIKKILIYRADAIGDYILTTPLINILKSNLPNAEIHFLVSPRNYHLAAENGNINKLYVYDGKFGSFFKLIPKISKEKYDLVFTFMIYKTSKVGTMLNVLTGKNTVKAAISHKEREKEYSVYFNILYTVLRNTCSLVELQARMVCDIIGADMETQQIMLDLPVSKENDEFAEEYLRNNQISNFAIYNVSAGRDYNQWSYKKNRDFLSEVNRNFPYLKIVIIASKTEKETAEKLIRSVSGQLFLYPTEADLSRIVALIEKSSLVISPDTAIVHIGAAKSKPILAFYSSKTSFLKEWEPYRVPYEMIISESQQPIESIPVSKAVAGLKKLIQFYF